MSTFGERLRMLREEKRISQEQAAEIFGVNRSTLSMWELDTRKPRKDKIDELRSFYGVTYEFLVGESPYRNEADREFYEMLENATKSPEQEIMDQEFDEFAYRGYKGMFMKFFDLTKPHKDSICEMVDFYYEKDKDK